MHTLTSHMPSGAHVRSHNVERDAHTSEPEDRPQRIAQKDRVQRGDDIRRVRVEGLAGAL